MRRTKILLFSGICSLGTIKGYGVEIHGEGIVQEQKKKPVISVKPLSQDMFGYIFSYVTSSPKEIFKLFKLNNHIYSYYNTSCLSNLMRLQKIQYGPQIQKEFFSDIIKAYNQIITNKDKHILLLTPYQMSEIIDKKNRALLMGLWQYHLNSFERVPINIFNQIKNHEHYPLRCIFKYMDGIYQGENRFLLENLPHDYKFIEYHSEDEIVLNTFLHSSLEEPRYEEDSYLDETYLLLTLDEIKQPNDYQKLFSHLAYSVSELKRNSDLYKEEDEGIEWENFMAKEFPYYKADLKEQDSMHPIKEVLIRGNKVQDERHLKKVEEFKPPKTKKEQYTDLLKAHKNFGIIGTTLKEIMWRANLQGQQLCNLDLNKEYCDALKNEADKGYVLSQYHYGDYLIEKNEVENGISYLMRAADQGHENALNDLKKLEVNHPGFFQDRAYRNEEDDYGLALKYQKKQDHANAFKYFEKAAHQGHAKALYELSLCYRYGCGAPKENIENADTYLYQAAHHGHPKAQLDKGLNLLYSYHEDPVKRHTEYSEGFKWLEKVISHYTDAQYEVGICYLEGKGITSDREKGLNHLSISAERGNTNAQEKLEELKEKDYFFREGEEMIKWVTAQIKEKGLQNFQKEIKETGHIFEPLIQIAIKRKPEDREDDDNNFHASKKQKMK